MRILLIEDDLLIGDGIKVGLNKLGFSVDWFTDGKQGQQAISSAQYDAIVLDLTLPIIDGLEVLAYWRKSGYTEPVLVLTARGTLDQRIIGLDSGADDYLNKPFALEELSARLRALIRRNHQLVTPIFVHGNVSFNPATQEIFINNEKIYMRPKEIRVVELFLLHKKKVFSRQSIEEKLYAWGEEVASNSVEVHIHHIRKKLGSNFISTVYGIGYKLNEAITANKDENLP